MSSVPEFNALQTRIEYQFRDISLLRLALTHPSVAQEQGRKVPHNQRLEFLGDAVLGLVIARELYDKFPMASEGPLTTARAQMINSRTLAEQARRIELQKDLILSRAEETNNQGRNRVSALSDAYEALLGAIFLDGGFDDVRAFILRSFGEAFGELDRLPALANPKGELQEILQGQSPDAPKYAVTAVTGPGHDRDFECIVTHGGVELGRGRGKSKQAAESEAAVAALKTLRAGVEP